LEHDVNHGSAISGLTTLRSRLEADLFGGANRCLVQSVAEAPNDPQDA
jgi:hypothetical protein